MKINVSELPFLDEKPSFGGSGIGRFEGTNLEMISWQGYQCKYTEIRLD